jgi:hypothetical protein
MSTDNTCEITKAGNIKTPKCRMGFPTLFVPKTPPGSDKAKFSISLVIPATADITLLKQAAAKAAKDKWGDKQPGKLKSPFLKAEECEGDKGPHFPPECNGWVVIRPTSLEKPGIVDATSANVNEPRAAYAGRWCRASLRAFAYDTNGNKGVSFGLQNIQLLDDAEPWGGMRARAEDEFEPVDAAGKSSDWLD